MSHVEDIVIVGGGPAGAYLGYLLAKNGLQPVLFDHSHPREKPCGGGVSVRALEKFPLLLKIPGNKVLDKRMILISSKGKHVLLSGKKCAGVLSRKVLDSFLLERAINSGCRYIGEQVVNIQENDNIWQITTKKDVYNARFIVGADGAHSMVRKKILGPIPKADRGLCYGCFATSKKKEIPSFKFYKRMQGYAWCFPRYDHLSIGVGMGAAYTYDIKKVFQEFLTTYYPHVTILSRWGAVIPNISHERFFSIPCAGTTWLVVGDAAGHVDPLTGEGILYALWSAALASEAIIHKDATLFDKLWRASYGATLRARCRLKRVMYNPYFLETSLGIALKSKTLSSLLYDLITNQIGQNDFAKNFIKTSPRIFKEYLCSAII